MTQSPLRLVVDHGEDTAPAAIELQPPTGAALHIHLHLAEARLSSSIARQPPGLKDGGRSGRGYTRPLMVGAAGLLLAIVAFDLGARSGAGHAQALAAARASVGGLASLAAMPPPTPEAQAPGDLPVNLQQQLAQRPTVTPAPGSASAGGSSDPFGLQH